MNPPSKDQWDTIQVLLEEAFDLDPDVRAAFLDKACADSPDVRQAVEHLLEADAKTGSLLDAPAVDQASPLLSEANETSEEAESEPNGTPLHADHRSEQQVGPWRLIKELGHGGMGVVYLAERADGQFEHRVAVKLLRFGLTSERLVQRFRAERQILASLQHPHIARLLDGGVTEEGAPWFAMEYVEGLPITDYCNEQGISTRERLELFVEVCHAVEHAHNLLIIHRDLKPSNILITTEGAPRLLDFGLAKVLAGGEVDEPAPAEAGAMTRTGERWMTLDYASPEQVKGDPIGTPSDTYQLGLVLYELLTGRRAYTVKDLSPTEAMRVICETPPTRPSTVVVSPDLAGAGSLPHTMPRGEPPLPSEKLRKRLKGDLDTIILKALQKDPDRRYASAESLADDIARHLSGLPIRARPDTFGYRAKKLVHRHPWRTGMAAALLLLTIGFVSFYTIRITAERDQAQLERDKAEEVTEFLTDLFEANDPNEFQGDIPSARDLLDLGVQRINESFDENPSLRAEMLVLLGGLYHALSEEETARPLLNEGLALADTHGSVDVQTRALQTLGSLLARVGDREKSLRALRRSERLMRENGLVPSARHGHVLLDLESQLATTDPVIEALKRTETALAAARAASDVPAEAMYYYLRAHGMQLRRAKRYNEAERLFQEAVALDLALKDAPVLRYEIYRSMLLLTMARGEREKASDLRDTILAFVDHHFPPYHTVRSNAFDVIAKSYVRFGRTDEAIAFQQRHLETLETLYPSQHRYYLAWVHVNLGAALQDAGRYSEAFQHVERARAIFEALFGRKHHLYARLTADLGNVRRHQDRLRESEAFLLRARDAIRRSPETDRYQGGVSLLALTPALLAELRLDEGQPTEALGLLDEALDFQRRTGAETEFFHQELLEKRARVLARLGRFPEAKSTYAAAIGMGDQATFYDGVQWPQLLAGYARFLVNHNDPEASEAVRRALEASRDIYGAEHPLTREMASLGASSDTRHEAARVSSRTH